MYTDVNTGHFNHSDHKMAAALAALKAELGKKRKGNDAPPAENKYMRRGDLEKLAQQKEQEAKVLSNDINA